MFRGKATDLWETLEGLWRELVEDKVGKAVEMQILDRLSALSGELLELQQKF